MRDVLNRIDLSEITRPVVAENAPTEDLLVKARDLYQAGRDEEALPNYIAS